MIGDTKEDTAINFAAALNASTNGAINVATYSAASNVVTGIYDTPVTGGNSFTMANSSASAVTRSGATFTGGGAVVTVTVTTNLYDIVNLSVFQFSTTGSLPAGMTAATN